jgi:Fur family ferric uptake transcriptional regulator
MRLRDRDWRLTPQRRVVAEVLDGENVHLTAETVHSRAQDRLPEISLATVYNTLNELVIMGEVVEVPGAGGAKRYDPNAHLPHHHLVCTSCGELWDVLHRSGGSVTLKDSERKGFEVTGIEIVFRGVCSDCQDPPAGA